MQVSVLLDSIQYLQLLYLSDSYFIQWWHLLSVQKQIINVSLAKAQENVMLLKFPDKQQNSLLTIQWNGIPGFFRKWEPWQ